jgi:acylphosphatase
VVATGRARGFWPRASLPREAPRLAVAGWVRNRRDGAVEAEAEGTPDALRQLVDWARLGPPGADVRDVAVTPLDAGGDGGDFVVHH